MARGYLTMLAEHIETLVTREHFDLKVNEIDRRIGHIEKALEPIKTQVDLLTCMMGIVILELVVPQLQSWFGVG